MKRSIEPYSLGTRIAAAMKQMGKGNADVARVMAVHEKTVSKWRNDVQMPSEQDLSRLALYLEVSVAYLRYGDEAAPLRPTGGAVGRGPSSPTLPRTLQIIAAEYEVEALKAGADEEDMRYIRMALRSQEAVELYHGGYVAPMSADGQRVEMESVVAMLRLWLTDRIRRRARKG